MLDKTLENHRLLKNCVEVLQVSLMPLKNELEISALFKKMCPLRGWNTFNKNKFDKKPKNFQEKYEIFMWGKVDWERFDKKIDVGFEPSNIIPALEKLTQNNFDKNVYIEWDMHIPVIKTNLDDIIRNFDVVSDVAPYEFIFSPISEYIIEVQPSGQITVGIFPTSDKFFQKETYIDPNILHNDVVFRECVEALKINLLPEDEERSLDAWFKKHVPITKWGRIDWDAFEKKTDIGYDYKNIKRVLSKFLGAKGPIDKTVYIEWGEIGIPVIKTNLDDVIQHFGALEPVSFEKFLFNPSWGYVIEILNSRQMTVGIVPGFNQKNDV